MKLFNGKWREWNSQHEANRQSYIIHMFRGRSRFGRGGGLDPPPPPFFGVFPAIPSKCFDASPTFLKILQGPSDLRTVGAYGCGYRCACAEMWGRVRVCLRCGDGC